MTPYYQRNGITIYCGDCKEILPGLKGIDSLITDPQYGIDFDTDYTRFTGGQAIQKTHQPIHGDNEPFDPSHLLNYRRVILWGANCYSHKLPLGAWLIWDKRTPNANKNVMSDAEVAWFNNGHGVYIFQHTWDGFNRASERGTAYHPTQKPVILMKWSIEKAKPQGVICDPYMGSGSTLRAAKDLGYPAIGIEISEAYCEIAVKRLQQVSMFEQLPQAMPEIEQAALW